MASKDLLHKVVTDLVCLASVGFPVLIFNLFGSPYHRGFYCSDESIRYPFKESTVTSSVLYTVGLGLPTLVIVIIEYSSRNNEPSRYSLRGLSIPNWLYCTYNNILWFLFGAACSQLTTDIGKYTIGRLRPHFLNVCDPQINCNDDRYKTIYIEDFDCHGEKPEKYKDSRLSFPSGHSSLSFYCMVYLALYLQARIKTSKYGMAKSLVQFLVISMAVFCALSRVSNYKHHWSDVLAGTLLGITVATITAKFVSDLFATKYKSLRKSNSSADVDIENTNNLQTTEFK